jgi:peptide deformylase
MKLPNIKILDEKDKLLRQVSKEVTFPLSKEDKQLIEDALTYLEMSQIEEYNKKYDLRAGMGLAFVQLGVLKRIFVIVEEVDEGKFEKYVVINPKIKSMSEELIYVGEGEGCLSVNRETEGIVPRHARITVDAYDENGDLYTFRAREDLAIAFQHEMDHLNGILFVDKIDKKNPFVCGKVLIFNSSKAFLKIVVLLVKTCI